jgi:hemolysin D
VSKNDSHEFKPILAEIEDSPLNPLAGTVFWLVITVFVSLVAWTIIGKIDIVVSATGKVVPDGQVKTVQPLDTGVVSKILVKEGDEVKRNQVLMEIDPSSTKPEVESTAKNLRYSRLESQRLVATLNGGQFGTSNAAGKALGSDLSTQTQLFLASRRSLEKQLKSKEQELKKVEQEINGSRSEKEENEKLLAIALEKETRLQKVQDLIAREDYERVVSDITTYKSKIDQANCKLAELDHEMAREGEEIERLREDFRTTNLKELADNQKLQTDLTAKFQESFFKNSKRQVISPVDGYIDKSFIHTIGGVVTPAEKLFTIVPSGTKLIVEAYVQNKDIGFVKSSLPAAIKVDAFDFQKYGMLDGIVRLVSADSREDDKLGQVFNVYVTPSSNHLRVEGKKRALQAGMTVVAEIKVGTRRIIEFFIYPVIKYLHEGMSIR